MNMKRTIEMILMTLLIIMAAAFVGSALTGCSTDEVIDKEVLEDQTEPLYQGSTSLDRLPTTEKKVGDWTFLMAGDLIREATFGYWGRESDYAKAPKSAEAFFSEYLPVSKDNKLVLTQEYTSGGIPQKYYKQYYKGIEVVGGYHCLYQPDGKTLSQIQGLFVPISDLDPTPHIDESLAKEIALAFITKGQGEFKDYTMHAQLIVEMFIKDGKQHVHLVYECTYSTKGWSNVFSAGIDAHTGRVLTYEMCIA